MDTVYGIKFFGALFAIMNPLVNLPIFLSLTDGLDTSDQRRVAIKTVTYAAMICVVVAVGGQQILSLFGISIDAFRVAGGIVLFGIAYHMLNGEHSTAHTGTASERQQQASVEDVSFYPLAFPMLVGPGTITALLVFLQEADRARNYIAYIVVVAVVLSMLFVTFYFAAAIGRKMSQTLRVITSRVMGMILLAIAIGMIAQGMTKLLPGLSG